MLLNTAHGIKCMALYMRSSPIQKATSNYDTKQNAIVSRINAHYSLLFPHVYEEIEGKTLTRAQRGTAKARTGSRRTCSEVLLHDIVDG